MVENIKFYRIDKLLTIFQKFEKRTDRFSGLLYSLLKEEHCPHYLDITQRNKAPFSMKLQNCFDFSSIDTLKKIYTSSYSENKVYKNQRENGNFD